jgi:hypothetical protein
MRSEEAGAPGMSAAAADPAESAGGAAAAFEPTPPDAAEWPFDGGAVLAVPAPDTAADDGERL